MAQTKTSHGDWRETMRKQQASALRKVRPCEVRPAGYGKGNGSVRVLRSFADDGYGSASGVARVYRRPTKIGGLFACIEN